MRWPAGCWRYASWLLVSGRARCRQVWRLVIDFATAGLLHFVGERCAVIALGIGQCVGLPLVIPTLGIQALGFLEVRDGFGEVGALVQVLAQPELRRGQDHV